MSKKKVGIIIGVIAAAVVAAGVGFYFLKGEAAVEILQTRYM